MPDPPEHIWPITFLRYCAIYHFWPDLSMVKNLFKNSSTVVESGSGFGSSPKSNQFVLVTHGTCPQNFIRIRQQLFEISCTQTDNQTNKQEKDVMQRTILAKSTPLSKGCHGYIKLPISLTFKIDNLNQSSGQWDEN